MSENVKGILLHLGVKFSNSKAKKDMKDLMFDEDVWNDIVDAMEKAGMNTIFLDILEGLHYGSHPELAIHDAWSRQKMREEIKRLKEKGITICPKLNFSACHDWWLGEYRFMRSTKEYYRVCRELIEEMCNLFEDSPYIHLGLDEEDHNHAYRHDYAAYRQRDLLWHDVQFLLDCVRDGGKTPVIWGDAVYYNYEEFKKHISPNDLVLMLYYYHGVKPEHWIRTDSREDYYKYYNVKGPFAGMGMEILERDDPFYIAFRENALKSLQDGYSTIVGCSNFYKHPYNTEDVVEMVTQDWPQDKVKGIITIPWKATKQERREHHLEAISLLESAFKKFGY